MLVGAAIARRAPSARVGACWLRRALPKPGHFRALATIPSAPVQKREEQEPGAPGGANDALKVGAGSAVAATTVLGGLPLATVAAAEAAVPAAFLTPGMIIFLQKFPPLAAQACFLAPMDTMKKIKADGDVGSLPLLPFAAMAGARAHSPERPHQGISVMRTR